MKNNIKHISCFSLFIFLLSGLPCKAESEIYKTAQATNEIFSAKMIFGENIIHQIKEGEFLYNIARMYNTSYPAVAKANGINEPYIIFTEQKLIIPKRTIITAVLENGLVVNIPEHRLYFFRNSRVARIYPICIGLSTWQTPVGEFTVTNKVKNPAWYMPDSIAEAEKVQKEIVPPGPENPLGDRWIGTSIKHTGIHGTNQPMSIGRALSHGCVRLYMEDINELFEEVSVKDKGIFIYKPIKICTKEDDIFIEAHPDIYSLIPDIEQFALKMLEEMNLLQMVDLKRLRNELEKRSGIPTVINK